MQNTPLIALDHADLTHWSLEADPFVDAEDPEAIWMSPQIKYIEGALKTAIQRRQIVVMTGEPGAGKSTIARRLSGLSMRQKTVRMITVASLDRSSITHTTLATAILRDLGIKDTRSLSGEERGDLLRQVLADQVQAGMFPVLVIDEAHHMRPKALLAVKQVWDSHVLFRQLAAVLIGQTPLAELLAGDPAVREVYGRSRMLPLAAMTEEDVASYLRFRFAAVHADADKVFAPGAYAALAARGKVPMNVNSLAASAMIYAAERGKASITGEIILRTT